MQYAVKGNQVFVIEANPRASRTVPFVAKATGVPLAKVTERIMVGATCRAADRSCSVNRSSVIISLIKEAVMPFNRPGNRRVRGPKMRLPARCGDRSHAGARRGQLSAGTRLPEDGMVFLSLLGGTRQSGSRRRAAFARGPPSPPRAEPLHRCERPVLRSNSMLRNGDGQVKKYVDLINAGDVKLVVSSPRGSGPRADGDHIRSAASREVPLLTTGAAALAAARGMQDWKAHNSPSAVCRSTARSSGVALQ